MGKGLFIYCLLFILLTSCNESEERAKKYITDSESKWAESVATSDTGLLHRILADDFVWVLNGRILNKKMAIADAAAGPGDFVSDHLDTIWVRFYGNTAVANGSETWVRRDAENKLYKGKFVWTDTWVERNKRWQIVSAEDISIPGNP